MSQTVKFYQMAITGEMDGVWPRYFLGCAQLDLGYLDDARISLDTVVQAAPEHAWAHERLGTVLRRMERHDPAVEAWQKAIELDPDYYAPRISIVTPPCPREKMADRIEHCRYLRERGIDPSYWQGD